MTNRRLATADEETLWATAFAAGRFTDPAVPVGTGERFALRVPDVIVASVSPGLRPKIGLVHYRGAEIARQLKLLQDIGRDEATAGIAVLFSSDRQEANRNILPTMTLAMNALPPGTSQRAHRHNAAALMLLIRSEGAYSLMDGKRKNWSPWATTVTPPVSVHSHYNGGDEQAMFLVVQDGGLFYHLRAMGFSFAEQPQ